MSNETIKTYLMYFYNYAPNEAQAIIDTNKDEEKRSALEDIIIIKKLQQNL